MAFPATSIGPNHAFMQQTLIAELLQQAEVGGLSTPARFRSSAIQSQTASPHTTIEEMSDAEARSHSAKGSPQEEMGASCRDAGREDSDSQFDEVGHQNLLRPSRQNKKYANRAELNRAAQQRYRMRRKARIHELEEAFENCKLYEMKNMALINELQRLKMENNMFAVREGKIMKLLESLEMVRHAMPGLSVEQQHSMVQEIAVSIQNVRNGVDPNNFVGERWQKLLPRILADDWNLTDMGIKSLLMAGPSAASALPIRPSDLRLQMTLNPAEQRIVSIADVMQWSWRDYHKVYSEYTAEAARLWDLHNRGDPGAGLRMAQLLQELRGMFIVFTVVDMRHQRILLMSNMKNLSVVPDHASAMVAQKCAAALLPTMNAQQKARVIELHQQYVERQAAIKARRAQLVPHAQATLDTDRELTPAEQVQALEAQGLLQANLDEELENMSLLSYVFTSVIMSAFQCAVMCAVAYPYGANLPAILEELKALLLAEPPPVAQGPPEAGPANPSGPRQAAPSQPPIIVAVLGQGQGQGMPTGPVILDPRMPGASLGDAGFTGVQLAPTLHLQPPAAIPVGPGRAQALASGRAASVSGESEATSMRGSALQAAQTSTAVPCDINIQPAYYIRPT